MTQPSEKDTKQNASKKKSAGNNANADSKGSKKKKKKSNTIILILIILILGSIVTFGAIFMFNFAGLKAGTSKWASNIPILGKVLKPLIENKSSEQVAWEEIELGKANNAIKLKEINDQKKELDQRAKNIEDKEKEIALKEQQIDEILLKLSDKLISVQEQVQYLEKVDNTKAMLIIMSMDDKASAVQVLRNMKKDKAAAILALMDPLQAAQLLEDLAEPQTVKDIKP
ncbi:MAG TPA: hypothetical protein PLL98_02445 [Bacillota bacterium]|nr:hypothetical protein [Bacillota bacterium]HOR85323.1 hypothetical protein [Bacillota bacterium]HPL53738.1 hypothetical protein [Bacillota bacterium]